ncbi:MAG: ABC transporter permease subunit [Firmicutes bacterium]|jgi:NitT/TauT family transport system permease protein|nr:ABC transporter permease subunit [Bacillota bacterium]NLO65723.1 ABC transporter permease subunit [Bacillota bacterium]
MLNNRRKVINKTLNQILFILALMLCWELLARTGWFPPLLFPRLSDVLRTLITDIRSGEIVGRLYFSLYLIAQGLALAVVTAAVAAVLALCSPIVSDWVQAVMAILHPLPGISVLPIIILWLGTGPRSIVAVIWFSSVWPLIANLHTGLRSVPATQIEVGQNLGLKGVRLIGKVLIPSAFPYILTGLRVAWARAWQASVAAEMVFGASGGEGGLGWFIYKKRFFMEIASVFGGMFVIIVVGLIVERLCFEWVEARTVRRWGMTLE